MRAVIQRVTKATVTVNQEHISSIDQGLCVLLGISRDDNQKDVDYMVKKILKLKLFEDDSGKRWGQSVVDKGFELLCVSQFTLYSVLKGNKPDFHQSMSSEGSKVIYDEFLKQLRESYVNERIKEGHFGAYMQVSIQNDGPVTINLESPRSPL